MKYCLLIIIFTFYSFNSFPQRYSGQLINIENGQPIPYANIGIIGKNIGTASDVAGRFNMELNSKYNKDTLCISCIGYESRKYLVSDFKDKLRSIAKVKIELTPKTYQLDEVIIQPFDTKIYTLGNFCESNSCYGNAFYSKELGTEVGVIIKIPLEKNKAFLNNFRFYVGEFTFYKFPVRLNIYNLKKGLPYENILIEPIFVEITSVGEYIIDLKKYNIITNGDFFISLEYYKIPDSSEGKLVFCAIHNEEMYKGNGYYRLASQGNWECEMFDNIGFSVQVECEE
jgi:hypothetical protein